MTAWSFLTIFLHGLRRRLAGRGALICVRSDANDQVRHTANPFSMHQHGCGMADSCRDGHYHFKAIQALHHILALCPSGWCAGW
ncbi:hypothetical protein BJY01DRAFT_206678 [Aspergillus pseudoustus]|uniref:Secreted protein n=1 Tax=Aspergillus pseudoustus TaxID=1810923 RepID=A0ABR4KMD8_9EURO